MSQEYIFQLETEKNMLADSISKTNKKLIIAMEALEAIEESGIADIAKAAIKEINNVDFLFHEK
tara:strand:- start:137 stop:328 length:192 start_codon:yes stop_codon:yes gene_type:complete